MAYEFKDMATIDVAESVSESAHVIVEDGGVIKRLPSAELKVDTSNMVTSWDDLEDKPFGGEKVETWIYDKTELSFAGEQSYDFETNDEISQLFSDAGNTVFVYWDGTIHECITKYHTMAMYYYVEFEDYVVYHMNDTFTLDLGSSTNGDFEFGLLSEYSDIKKLDEQYIPDTVVKTQSQTFSDTEKMQARANLGLYYLAEEPVMLYNDTIAGGTINTSIITADKMFNTIVITLYDHNDAWLYEETLNKISSSNFGGESFFFGNRNLASSANAIIYGSTYGIETSPILLYRGDDNPSGWSLYLDESYLENKDEYGAYTIEIIDAINTESIYDTIPLEYLPSDIPKMDDVVLLETQSIEETQRMQARNNLGLYCTVEEEINDVVVDFVYTGTWDILEDNFSHIQTSGNNFKIVLAERYQTNEYEIEEQIRTETAPNVGIVSYNEWYGNGSLIGNDDIIEEKYADLPFVIHRSGMEGPETDFTLVFDSSYSNSMGDKLTLYTIRMGDVSKPVPEEYIPDLSNQYVAVGTKSIVLSSSTEGSTKQFVITVDDSGEITATEL